MITERKTLGNWTFTYMGANQDLSVVSQNLNIDLGNMLQYSSTTLGTGATFTHNAYTLGQYREQLTRNVIDGSTSTFYCSNGTPLDLTQPLKS